MIHLTFRTNALLITMPLLALLASSNTHAEIYKWRDNRGVTQYSDRPPVSSFSKLTSNELVNSLQTKDLCTVGPIKKSVASNAAASAKENSGFFNIFSRATLGATPAKSVAAASNSTSRSVANVMPFAKTSIAPLQVASATTTFKPVTTAASNSFSRGGVSVMSFGKTSFSPIQTANATTASKPIMPINVPAASNPTQPAKTTPSVTAPATQVATAPPATTNILTPINNVTNIIQTALMPAVDISKNVLPALGSSNLLIMPIRGGQDIPTVGDGDGQFRIDCDVSHMSNDDPILYPRQKGAAHHHTFFGNTSLNANSDLKNLINTGNSTCRGGIANRSAYWVPSMIDTSTNTPIKPSSALWYYKTGYAIDKSKIQPIPNGLRMIAGNMKAKTEAENKNVGYTCTGKEGFWKSIPNCAVGSKLVTHVGFPQCWDGKNLDSPDHISHMNNHEHVWSDSKKKFEYVCPSTHPVAIPRLDLNIWYDVKSSDDIKKWRLSSDNYQHNGSNAGYSIHGDVVFAWDEKVIKGVVKNCLNAGVNCGNHMLGDGTIIYK